MADSRFKPGDRVVHVATNSTFINGWNPSNRTTEMTSFVLLQSVSF